MQSQVELMRINLKFEAPIIQVQIITVGTPYNTVPYENSPLPMLTLLATVTAAGDVHCLWGYLVFTVSLLSSTSSLYS